MSTILAQEVEKLLDELEDCLDSYYQPSGGPPGPDYFEQRANEIKKEILDLVRGR